MAQHTLLLPCAGRSTRYPGVRPKWMMTLPNGDLVLRRAADCVPKSAYERIVVTVRADHEAAFGCKKVLARAFDAAVDVVVLERDTRGPAETVAETIRAANVTGPVAIKDCDSFFSPTELPTTGFVAVSDVRQTPEMSSVGGKSFAVINADGLIVEMIEKSLVSNFVSVGLYGFADAGVFSEHFSAVSAANPEGEIFVSHVLNRAIAAGMPTRPLFVHGLIDVGTLADWRRHVRARGTIVCDIDGIVFKNQSQFFPPYWEEDGEPIAENIAALRAWQDGGAQIIFMTARPEVHRAKTAAALEGLGLKPHALVMGCSHGRRFLVNDHAASNPFPSAVGISIDRNSPSLDRYLSDWK